VRPARNVDAANTRLGAVAPAGNQPVRVCDGAHPDDSTPRHRRNYGGRRPIDDPGRQQNEPRLTWYPSNIATNPTCPRCNAVIRGLIVMMS
jgi:hypothetical protein